MVPIEFEVDEKTETVAKIAYLTVMLRKTQQCGLKTIEKSKIETTAVLKSLTNMFIKIEKVDMKYVRKMQSVATILATTSLARKTTQKPQ